MNFFNEASKISEELIQVRRDFHRNPELDYDLHRTSQKIREYFQNEGIEYSVCAKTGVVAIVRGDIQDDNSKTIAIRGDMDALPIVEKKDTLYSSKHIGKMHACGHDAHMTMVLGAAKLLNKYKKNIRGNIKFIFEPAEETTGGAKLMIEEGALKNPAVDAIIGCHVDESFRAGTIGIKRGVAYAASNPFKIVVRGKGTHGASPHRGVDPIAISAQVINVIQTLISRELCPTSPGVVTFGTINGGVGGNIIPDEVVMTGIIRTLHLKDREFIVKRFKEVVESQVKLMRGSCEIMIDESYPCVRNDDHMFEFLYKTAVGVLGDENVMLIQEPTMGVESFSYFSLEKPSVFYQLGCGNIEKGIIHPLHSSLFDIDEECLKIGVALHCEVAIQYLND